MEREIKFRIFDRGDNAIHSHYTLRYDHIMENIGDGTFELMQFTGLHDKNGKEIYEGDVVYYEDHEWEVVFNYDRWDMQSQIDRDMFVRSNDISDDPSFTEWGFCEIIGNIYENI